MNRIIAKAVFVVAVMSLGAMPHKVAAYASGNSLYAWCLSASRSQRGLCDGYILGVADAMGANQKIGEVAACIPTSVRTRSWAQIINVAKQFLASHPEKRQLSAAGLVASAFAEAFPCH